jgi:hypothetical protein
VTTAKDVDLGIKTAAAFLVENITVEPNFEDQRRRPRRKLRGSQTQSPLSSPLAHMSATNWLVRLFRVPAKKRPKHRITKRSIKVLRSLGASEALIRFAEAEWEKEKRRR